MPVVSKLITSFSDRVLPTQTFFSIQIPFPSLLIVHIIPLLAYFTTLHIGIPFEMTVLHVQSASASLLPLWIMLMMMMIVIVMVLCGVSDFCWIRFNWIVVLHPHPLLFALDSPRFVLALAPSLSPSLSHFHVYTTSITSAGAGDVEGIVKIPCEAVNMCHEAVGGRRGGEGCRRSLVT